MANKALIQTGKPVKLDGRHGEGGGQILRTSLALSAITGRPLQIHHIRGGRAKPGLRRQHLTAVKAAAKVCSAHITGAKMNSQELSFKPGRITAGDYEFAIGTGGSAMLVLQTVIPILLHADGPSTISIRGGTHNDFSPPYEFLALSWLPLVQKMGVDISMKLIQPGYAQIGGREVQLSIRPVKREAAKALTLTERGQHQRSHARIRFAHIPFEIAEREMDRLHRRLHFSRNNSIYAMIATRLQDPAMPYSLFTNTNTLPRLVPYVGTFVNAPNMLPKKPRKQHSIMLTALIPLMSI